LADELHTITSTMSSTPSMPAAVKRRRKKEAKAA
jgi:hypothetical protein